MNGKPMSMAINGYFYKQKTTGLQRGAHQIVLALDRIAEWGTFELVVPVSAKIPGLENIENARCGDGSLFKWGQVASELNFLIERRPC